MTQIKNSFDQETIYKILKGACIAACGTFALYILKWMGTLDYGNQLTPIIAAVIPIIVNAINEYLKGD